MRRIGGVFLILSSIVIIAQFRSNTVNFGDCARLVLFQSLEKAKNLCIQLEKVFSLFHMLIHSHLEFRFQLKVSTIQGI